MAPLITHDFINANKKKTRILMVLFPFTMLAAVYLTILLLCYLKFAHLVVDQNEAYSIYSDIPQAFQLANTYASIALPITLILVIIALLIGLFSGKNFILSKTGAIQLTKENAPEIMELVENVAKTAEVPTPKVYLIVSNSLNAFATGRNPKRSCIALTAGIIDKLEVDELEGVIAHEISHIKNYDIRITLASIVCASLATGLAGYLFKAAKFVWGGWNLLDIRKILFFIPAAFLAIAGIMFSIYGYLFAPLMSFAVSRTREYQADATAALITKNPQGLIGALKKISGHSKVEALKNRENIASICIESPLGKHKQSLFSRLSGLFSTHPPIKDRIQALKKMDNSQGTVISG